MIPVGILLLELFFLKFYNFEDPLERNVLRL